MKPGIKLEGKRVLVVGLARTGVASALFCAGRGAHVTATDEKPEAELPTGMDDLRAAGVTLELGGHNKETFLAQELILQSPGVPAEMECFVAARQAGVAVWSELELAWRFLRGRLIGITGANGKTTTTALVGHILANAGLPTLVGGNIGTPLISLVDVSSDATLTVAEMSSFQLETIVALRPDIAVWLNLTPDHLDRHASFQLYGQAKARIFENQRENDAAILNADDPETPRYAPTGPRVHWFSRQQRVMSGAFVREHEIVFRQDGEETVLLRRNDIGLRGEHNVENVLAAAAAAFLAGAPPSAIAEGVRTFAGVEHRLEFVANIGGVEYFNDSKATNVDATLKAIDAFAGNVFIILGGKDKGGDFTALREPLHRRGKLALTIGKAAEKISAQIAGAVAVEAAETLERAVHLAHAQAKPGDVVLLAPACASFDQFENYEHRGRVFKQVVRGLMKAKEGEKQAS